LQKLQKIRQPHCFFFSISKFIAIARQGNEQHNAMISYIYKLRTLHLTILLLSFSSGAYFFPSKFFPFSVSPISVMIVTKSRSMPSEFTDFGPHQTSR